MYQQMLAAGEYDTAAEYDTLLALARDEYESEQAKEEYETEAAREEDEQKTSEITGPYGNCECGMPLVAHWFLERQTDERGYFTGMIRKNVDVLVCPICLREYCVDDSFAGAWHRNKE